MSPSDSQFKDHPPDSGPVLSRNVETPRGGFMARPGLKAPPKHAVVVRGGDAPESEHIPLARPSILPPPPSTPPVESASEKITLRAVPTRSAPPPAVATLAHTVPAVVESVPPPSDAPVVANVYEREESRPRARRALRSYVTIVAAAAAGLILGLVSVATTVRVSGSGAATPVALTPLETPSAQAAPLTAPSAGELARPVPRRPARSEPSAAARAASPAAASERARRSIF